MVKYSVIAVMHYLHCLAFSLARLLSQLNYTKTPTSPQDNHRLTLGYSLSHAIIYSYVYIYYETRIKLFINEMG